MINRLNFEDQLKQELTAKASEVEISDLMFNRIVNRIEHYNGGNRSMLKDKIKSVFMRKWIAISLTAILVVGGVMFTFSADVRAATLNVLDKIKTIFVLEKSQGEYKLVEKTTKYPIFVSMCGGTTTLSDAELSRKMEFKLVFPKTLYGEYRLYDKSEVVGIDKEVSLEISEQIRSDMLKAVDDEVAFNGLSEYNPYRNIFATYKAPYYKEGDTIYISINSTDGPAAVVYGEDIITIKETSVGEAKALWIEYEYPKYEPSYRKSNNNTKSIEISMKHFLSWDYNGVRYKISPYPQSELAMEEVVKIAESFMAAQ